MLNLWIDKNGWDARRHIKCVPLYSIFHFCLECDMVTAFDSNCHCFICGCDSPDGEFYDPDIPDSFHETAYLMQEILY